MKQPVSFFSGWLRWSWKGHLAGETVSGLVTSGLTAHHFPNIFVPRTSQMGQPSFLPRLLPHTPRACYTLNMQGLSPHSPNWESIFAIVPLNPGQTMPQRCDDTLTSHCNQGLHAGYTNTKTEPFVPSRLSHIPQTTPGTKYMLRKVLLNQQNCNPS